jgi:hypothetical protein
MRISMPMRDGGQQLTVAITKGSRTEFHASESDLDMISRLHDQGEYLRF